MGDDEGQRRYGITLPLGGVPLAEQRPWIEELADLGYTDAWTAEIAGLDAFTPLACAAVWAPRLRLGTAIASVFARGPALLAMNAAALAEVAPGRFVLGIGSSSEAIVSGWNAQPFERPYGRVRDTLRFLRAALAGERVDERYETFEVRGFRLERPPREPPPVFVAGLRERMLGLAGREGDGALLGLVAPEDVPKLAGVVHAQGSGDQEIALRIGVVPTTDAERARSACRRILAAYLSAPPYAAMHTWLGRSEILEPLWTAWRSGDRRAAVAAVPDALVDELFVHGSPEACREGIARFVDAGVTTPVISIMPLGGDVSSAMRALSPAAEAARA